MSADAALMRLERQVLGISRVSGFLDAVDTLRRLFALESPDVRRRVLLLAAPQISRDLAAAVESAWNLGIADAMRGLEDRPTIGGPPKSLFAAAREAERKIAADVRAAKKLARVGADAATVLAPASAARNSLSASVTTLVNQAGNMGTTAVADAVGLPTVWVAETNACVVCLAYSGHIAKPGATFPGGLTYGAKSYFPTSIETPPRHPHCRCTVEVLHSADYAAALRREADRSVLRGFSLESESMAVRLDAAERLVATDPDAPKSVIAYAKRSVRNGEFATRGR